jgi:hypothetical protein
LKKDLQPFALTWQTAMHTTRGLQATMTILQNTWTGTRSWLMGTRDIASESTGWREYDCGDNERGRRVREEYMEEEWDDAGIENGGAGEEPVGAEGGGDSVGVG